MDNRNKKISAKIIVTCTLLPLFTLNILCQDTLYYERLKNSIHLDCATALYIGMVSINFERTFISSNHYKLMLKTGFGAWYFVPIPKEYIGLSVPLSFNYLIGSGNNYFEVDLGVRYTFLCERSDKDRFNYFPIINFGYRFQRPSGKGLIFRLFIGYTGLGIGIGKAF